MSTSSNSVLKVKNAILRENGVIILESRNTVWIAVGRNSLINAFPAIEQLENDIC